MSAGPFIAITLGAGFVALGVRIFREDRTARGLELGPGDAFALVEEVAEPSGLNRAGSGHEAPGSAERNDVRTHRDARASR